MRNFRALRMLAVIGLLVFAISGCGGGSLDPETSTETEQTIPNDSPDTYDTQRLLEGSWRALDDSYEFSAEDFSFRLNSALLAFSSTDIKGTVAQSKITSHQYWYTDYTSGDVVLDLGLRTLGLDFYGETGTMIHQGKDRWRCNIDGESKVVMNIEVLSETLIEVNYQGVTGVIHDNTGAAYDFTLTFRKEEYTR